jgi:hypothetical protein
LNYDIKILGSDDDNGLLEFDRLRVLTTSTKAIATKALMLKLRGFSDIAPDARVKKALEFRLRSISGNADNGTTLEIVCEQFSESLKSLQYELFRPGDDVLRMTPMSLIIDAFRSAQHAAPEESDVDKPLLLSLLGFKKNFQNDTQQIFLSNRGSVPALRLTKADFAVITRLGEAIPAPRNVIINGQLDEMKFSKGKLGVLTEKGFVHVFTNDDGMLHRLIDYLGKEVTMNGMAHYRPNGRLSFVEIQDFRQPGEGDRFFSRPPEVLTARQQVLFQVKEGKELNPLNSIIGKWPGDETDEEFAELLRTLKS